MGFLGKRLSSVLLCGSMAFTIANSAGVAYAAGDEQDVEEGAGQQNGVADGGEEEQGEENESGNEVEGNSAAQAVESSEGAEGEATPSETGKGGGGGAAVAGGLAVGGLAAGVGIDRGIGYLKGKSGANNNNNNDSSVSVDEVKKEIERQVKEAYEKGLKEGENTASAADNAVFAALSGWIGELIPGVDALVSKWFGKNIDKSSRAAIIAFVVVQVIGFVVAGTNVAGLVRNRDKEGKASKGWRMLKIGTGVFFPPIGIALQLAESIIKATWKEKAAPITDKQAVDQLMVDLNNFVPGTAEAQRVIDTQALGGFQQHILQKVVNVYGNCFKNNQGNNMVLDNTNLAFANG